MKSFLLVRSQSQTSTDSRLSLSVSRRLLQEHTNKGNFKRKDKKRFLLFKWLAAVKISIKKKICRTMWKSRSRWGWVNTWWFWFSACFHSSGQESVWASRTGPTSHSGPSAPGSEPPWLVWRKRKEKKVSKQDVEEINYNKYYKTQTSCHRQPHDSV